MLVVGISVQVFAEIRKKKLNSINEILVVVKWFEILFVKNIFFFLLEKKRKKLLQKKNTNLNQIECICDIRTGIATILKTRAGK